MNIDSIGLQNLKCISRKPQSIVCQYYSPQGLLMKKKVLFNLTVKQNHFYHNLLNSLPKGDQSELKKSLSEFRFQVKIQQKIIQISEIFISFPNVTTTIKQNWQNLTNQNQKSLTFSKSNIKILLIDLVDRLISDGNRAFLPTLFNIYLSGQSVLLNHTSFAGLSFLFLKNSISKKEFFEICGLLPSNVFKTSSFPNFVSIKQRAVLLFILSLLFEKEVSFVFQKEIPEIISIIDAEELLKTQKKRSEKYFKNKYVVAEINKFEETTKLKLLSLAKRLFVEEEKLNWAQFIWELLSRELPNYPSLIQQQLRQLAYYHWALLQAAAQKKLINDGIVGEYEDKWEKRDYDLLLIRLTKIPLSELFQAGSFEGIIRKKESFSSKSYGIWVNFIKALPKQLISNASSGIKLKNRNSQSHQQNLSCILTIITDCKGSLEKFEQPAQLSILDPKFILQVGQAKLKNCFKVQSKEVVMQHEHLKTLKSFCETFR